MRLALFALVVLAAACIERRDYAVSDAGSDAAIDAPIDTAIDTPGATSTVDVTVNGPGRVSSDRGGIACPGVCTATLPATGAVTLTPTADSGAVFKEWQGACDGDGVCVLDLQTSHVVTAVFVSVGPQHNLQVLMSGAGGGQVRSTPAGIVCTTGTCNAPFTDSSTVQLTALADSDSRFTSWGSACSGSSPVCSVFMGGARTVIANFTPIAGLSVVRTGTGTGTVTSSPAGISCGTDCDEDYLVGDSVALTATPAVGSRFVQWGGACSSATDACSVTLTGNTTVTAEFASP